MVHSRMRQGRASCSRGECSRRWTVMLRFSGLPEREAFVIQEEALLWRERYRVLFGENVAGTILTTPEGRIVDCNEACARIFGFDSREEMLAHSAWDLYFNRSEREILLDRLRTKGSCPREEVCLKDRNGAPI